MSNTFHVWHVSDSQGQSKEPGVDWVASKASKAHPDFYEPLHWRVSSLASLSLVNLSSSTSDGGLNKKITPFNIQAKYITMRHTLNLMKCLSESHLTKNTPRILQTHSKAPRRPLDEIEVGTPKPHGIPMSAHNMKNTYSWQVQPYLSMFGGLQPEMSLHSHEPFLWYSCARV